MGVERTFRWIAIASLTLSLTIAAGAGIGRWTTASTTGFYTDPGARADRRVARDRAIAESFWDRQQQPMAAAR